MKIKKLIALNLILMAVLLTACGKDADTKDNDETVTAESTEENAEPLQSGNNETVTEEISESSAEEESENPALEESDAIEPLQIEIDYKSVNYSDTETYDTYMEYEDERVILSEEDCDKYPALAGTLQNELDKRDSAYQSEIDTLIEFYNEEKESGNTIPLETHNKMWVERADSLVLSIRESSSGYTGGAHGMYGNYGYNYDTLSGLPLKFSDVVTDPVAFLNLANEKIQEPFSGDFETPATLDDYLEDYDTSIIWTVDYRGVRIYFNPYTLGSYALGAIETEIYFAEAPELFNSKYFNIPESYATELDTLEPSFIDIDNDGETEKITIISKYDEYSSVCGADIEIEGNNISIDVVPEQYFYVSDKGKNYILISALDEIGYPIISCIDLSAMTLKTDYMDFGSIATYNSVWKEDGDRSEYNCTKTVFTDPEKVLLSTYIQYLGTMSGCDYYHMEGNSNFVANTGIYRIDSDSILVANTDIECEQVDLSGEVIGETVIPERTRLVVRRGDGQTFADLIEVPEDADVSDYEYYISLNSVLEMEDADIIYRVRGELNEYGSQAIINGQEEYLVFSNIMYWD